MPTAMAEDALDDSASLLWAYQLKREHVYLLERLESLESKSTARSPDSDILQEVNSKLGAVNEQQNKLQQDVATLRNDCSDIHDDYSKLLTQQENITNNAAMIRKSTAAVDDLTTEMNRKILDIETKMKKLDRDVSQKLDCVVRDVAMVGALKDTVGRNQSLYSELETRIFNVESHVDQSKDLLTRATRAPEAFVVKRNPLQEQLAAQSASVEPGSLHSSFVQLDKVNSPLAERSTVSTSQQIALNSSPRPFQTNYGAYSSQKGFQSIGDFDVLDLESSPSFQRGRSKIQGQQRYHTQGDGRLATVMLEPTLLGATGSDPFIVKTDFAAKIQRLRKQDVKSAPLRGATAFTKRPSKRRRTAGPGLRTLSNITSPTRPVDTSNVYRAGTRLGTDGEFLAAQTVPPASAPKNALHQKDLIDAQSLDLPAASNVAIAPTRNSEEGLNMYSRDGSVMQKAPAANAEESVPATCEEIIKTESFGLPIETKKKKKAKQEPMLRSTRQTRSKTKATTVESQPKPGDATVSKNVELQPEGANQREPFLNHDFQSARGANSSFEESVMNKQKKSDPANAEPLQSVELKSPTDTILRNRAIGKNSDIPGYSIAPSNLEVETAPLVKSDRVARHAGLGPLGAGKSGPRPKRQRKQAK